MNKYISKDCYKEYVWRFSGYTINDVILTILHESNQYNTEQTLTPALSVKYPYAKSQKTSCSRTYSLGVICFCAFHYVNIRLVMKQLFKDSTFGMTFCTITSTELTKTVNLHL